MCGIMEWEVDHDDCKFEIVDPRDKGKRGVGLGTGSAMDIYHKGETAQTCGRICFTKTRVGEQHVSVIP